MPTLMKCGQCALLGNEVGSFITEVFLRTVFTRFSISASLSSCQACCVRQAFVCSVGERATLSCYSSSATGLLSPRSMTQCCHSVPSDVSGWWDVYVDVEEVQLRDCSVRFSFVYFSKLAVVCSAMGRGKNIVFSCWLELKRSRNEELPPPAVAWRFWGIVWISCLNFLKALTEPHPHLSQDLLNKRIRKWHELIRLWS